MKKEELEDYDYNHKIEYGFEDKTMEKYFKIIAILATVASIIAFALIIKLIFITDFTLNLD